MAHEYSKMCIKTGHWKQMCTCCGRKRGISYRSVGQQLVSVKFGSMSVSLSCSLHFESRLRSRLVSRRVRRPPGRLVMRRRGGTATGTGTLGPFRMNIHRTARCVSKLQTARTLNLTNYSNREKWQRMVRSSKSACLRYQACVSQLLLLKHPYC